MVIERKKLKSLEIDLEKNIYKLNGEDMRFVSRIDISYNNGEWTLFLTKDEVYSRTVPDKIT
ncbi:hypothetical protein HMPREF1216_00449 [Coprococcus sp. HPP0048]|nr:hypothetical protein HMPREF1216_00449 [Coprococcus sp. HPP0048]DAO65207.1 MAG TPA: hypothetical protein [Caudoviricetes sp.]